MPPDESLARAQAARQHEEARIAQARPVTERLDRIEQENHIAALFRQAFGAGR